MASLMEVRDMLALQGRMEAKQLSARLQTPQPLIDAMLELMSSQMATTIFQGLGLPPIVINEDMVELEDGTMKQVFKDNRISLFTTAKQGKMRWHTPYEITDPVPGKTYTRSEGGMYISNVRTDEGRFMEYGCEWIPEYTNPNKIVIFDLDTMLA